jgi:hypothetical protein
MLSRADRTLPGDARTVVAINPPADAFTGYIMMWRACDGRRMPAHLRWLATGSSAITLERIDPRTVRVTLDDGFLVLASERMQRSPSNPLRVGDEVALSDMTVRVTAVTSDARPKQVEARFDVPLDDPSLVFLQWTPQGYVPFQVPAVGKSARLDALDFTTLQM